ncbi:hypothetical protein [uncultured Endozoicomonas sp.]|uniref:hypothetical protein n=1 Tax=uncultured Endozoicomonas sp. TaxID=432652 RepID=UPI002622DD51|nr:hypothetical protein [uncultured Endozoicomonas sp.]
MKRVLALLGCLIFTSPIFAGTPQLKPQHEYKKDSQQLCSEEWTKRGALDLKMYNHCMRGQDRGYDRVKEIHVYADQQFYTETAYPYCVKQWSKRGTVDIRMLASCLEKEVEGFKDVIYYRENYDENQVNDLVKRALSKYGSWNSVAYRLKKEFR